MAIRACIRDTYVQNTRYELPHDWELNIIADEKGGLYFLNEPLIDYRIHGGNAIGLSKKAEFSDEPFMTRRFKRHEVMENAIRVTLRYVKDPRVVQALTHYASQRRNALELSLIHI